MRLLLKITFVKLKNIRYTARICDLLERVELLQQKEYEWGTEAVWSNDHLAPGIVHEGDTLVIRNASCAAPDGRLLIRGTTRGLKRKTQLN